MVSSTLEFFDDPADFLAAAAPLLDARPVPSTVVASVTHRIAGTDPSMPVDPQMPPRWWVLVRDLAGVVVGAGMRTAPFAPYPIYLLDMPDDAARALAQALHARGEVIAAASGWMPAIDVFAGEYADLAGASVAALEQLNLYELGELVEPALPPGRLRQAVEEDVDLVLEWFDDFNAAASEQSGRVDPHPGPIETRASTAGRIANGEVWLWEDPSGTPAHVTAFNPTAFGVARIGPVYTPRHGRGNGYAAAAVAEVSRMLLDQGARVCLFADRDNLVSSELYLRLGYRAVGETRFVAIIAAG
jgi:RimJ/RimL family protein N-acetyltransferase